MQIHDLYFENEQDYIDTLNELIDKYEKSLAEIPFTETILIIESLKIMLKQFTDKSNFLTLSKLDLKDVKSDKIKEAEEKLFSASGLPSNFFNNNNISRTNAIGFEHDNQEHKRGLL